MNKSLLFLLLLTISYQSNASQSYNTLMDIIRKNMSTVQHKPYDLTEYDSQVIFSRENVFGEREEILELSDVVFRLVTALTDEEKIKLPEILLAAPGTFAMKFYFLNGFCNEKYITRKRPTADYLDRKRSEVPFYK